MIFPNYIPPSFVPSIGWECSVELKLVRDELLKILACPACRSTFKLQVLSAANEDGLLVCDGGHYFPITHGLLRMLVGGLESDYSDFVARNKKVLESHRIKLYSELGRREESKQVQEAFREKWTLKDTMGIDDSSPYKAFMRDWMLRKYGWKDENGLARELRERRLILDAGAGLGREVINLAKDAKNSIVIGLEFSDCAVNALKNIRGFSNACMIQGDILNMPFAQDSFDFILSEGVLHHTPNTRGAFSKCCAALRKGGEIAFYIYRRKGPLREFADDYLRQVMQEASAEEKWAIARRLTSLGKALADTHATLKMSEDFPELGIKEGETNVQRLVYYNFIKCFWNDRLPFDENMIINFDWYAPKHAHRHTEEEIRGWCKENMIDIIWFLAEDSGYSVRGIKT